MQKKLDKFYSHNHSIWSVLVILLGSLTWSLTMVKSGWLYEYGMGFWGPNGHDGVWHIAVANSLANGTWDMPIFAGSQIQNYHIGFDLLLAWVHKITFIPINNLYFQIIPPILALGVGIVAYKFVFNWTSSKASAVWSTFFIYFGGSFGWIVSLMRGNGIGGESMFWSQQSISTLINPPFALSLVLVFIALDLLISGMRSGKRKYFVTVTIIIGVLIQIKVYAGLLMLGGILIAGIIELMRKRDWRLFKVFSGALILSLVLFLPLNLQASSSVEFKPFWFLETMMGISDRLGWDQYFSAMNNYRLGGQWVKMVSAYSGAFVIFIVGNFGLRLFGLLLVFKWMVNVKKIKFMDVIFLSIITAGVVMPMLFLQKGTPWNTIQFTYYSLMFTGVIAGIVVGEITNASQKSKNMYDVMIHHTRKYIFPVIVVVLVLPTSLSTLRLHYLPSRPPAKLSTDELNALEFLSVQPRGVVLTYPYDRELAIEAISNPPRPLYLYESTAYISAYSMKPVFLEDEVNLNITGFDWPDRRELVEEFLIEADQIKARDFLRENNIKYIYWVGGQRALLGEKQLGIEKIFENKVVDLYTTQN